MRRHLLSAFDFDVKDHVTDGLAFPAVVASDDVVRRFFADVLYRDYAADLQYMWTSDLPSKAILSLGLIRLPL